MTFQAVGEVQVDDVPEPEISAADDAVVRIEASGICGSDLHIFHGRHPVEQGFTIGHEFVGRVIAAGDGAAGSAATARSTSASTRKSSATARSPAGSRGRRPSRCSSPTRT